MAPNVYAHVTLLQPHAQTANDRPDPPLRRRPRSRSVSPQTRLQPVAGGPGGDGARRPRRPSTVREATGRPMAYTVAVVDEGLLGLTRFQTPNPWDHFYAREALAVRTWDLYDDVLGAYGAAMERMLAIGGDEAAVAAQGRRANRFPPMVRFLGPFRLAAKAAGTHRIEIPQYVGAVRVMVVAGRGRRLRRGREVRLRAPAADAPRHAAARARPRGERRAARVGLRARAEGEGRRRSSRHDLGPARGGGRERRRRSRSRRWATRSWTSACARGRGSGWRRPPSPPRRGRRRPPRRSRSTSAARPRA